MSNKRIFWCFVFWGLVLGFENFTFAFAASELETQIQNQLMQRHPTQSEVAARTWWRGLGSQAPAAMINLYEHSKNVHHQVQLLEALRHFSDSPLAMGYLRKSVEEGKPGATGTDEIFLVTALGALAIAGKEPRDVDLVAKFLNDENVQLRVAAARALKKMGTAPAMGLYEKYLKSESVSWAITKAKNENLELPPGVFGLLPVTTSEEAVPLTIYGQYRGFWIHTAKAGEALLGWPLKVEVKSAANRDPLLEAWVDVPVKGVKVGATEPRELIFKLLEFKKQHLRAQVTLKTQVLSEQRPSFTVDGDFLEREGKWVLELRGKGLAEGWMLGSK